MAKGPQHARKLPKGRKKTRRRDDSTAGLLREHAGWMEGGGLRMYERDFSEAPIAKMFGMPYRPPLSPHEVARAQRGNSHGDGCPGPQDESVGNPDGGLNSSDHGTGR